MPRPVLQGFRTVHGRYALVPGSGRMRTMTQVDTLDTIDTPALLLDSTRMDRNIERMRRHAEALGCCCART